jgi:hypothetical protein
MSKILFSTEIFSILRPRVVCGTGGSVEIENSGCGRLPSVFASAKTAESKSIQGLTLCAAAANLLRCPEARSRTANASKRATRF